MNVHLPSSFLLTLTVIDLLCFFYTVMNCFIHISGLYSKIICEAEASFTLNKSPTPFYLNNQNLYSQHFQISRRWSSNWYSLILRIKQDLICSAEKAFCLALLWEAKQQTPVPNADMHSTNFLSVRYLYQLIIHIHTKQQIKAQLLKYISRIFTTTNVIY